MTNGTATIVSPLELQRKMRQIIDNPPIAKNVMLKMFITKGFVIRSDALINMDLAANSSLKSKYEEQVKKQNSNYIELNLGTVTAETDLSFEFAVSDKKIASKLDSVRLQAVVEYTNTAGDKLVRVFNATKNIVHDRFDAEQESNISVLGLNAVQQGAKLAQLQAVQQARMKLLSVQRLCDRINASEIQQEEYGNFVQWSQELENALRELQKSFFLSDSVTRMLTQGRSSPKFKFLASIKKKDIVAKRKKHTEQQAITV